MGISSLFVTFESQSHRHPDPLCTLVLPRRETNSSASRPLLSDGARVLSPPIKCQVLGILSWTHITMRRDPRRNQRTRNERSKITMRNNEERRARTMQHDGREKRKKKGENGKETRKRETEKDLIMRSGMLYQGKRTGSKINENGRRSTSSYTLPIIDDAANRRSP